MAAAVALKTLLIACLLLVGGLGAQTRSAPPLRLLRSIPLPGVHGRIDHFDADYADGRLFMSALGNDTVEVFDLRDGRLIHTIRGLHEPQGVSYAPGSGRLYVANGGDGTVAVFDARSYRRLGTIHLASDADDTRYADGCIFVGYGGRGDAGLAILDASTGARLRTLRLPAHPESFQVAASGGRIYVNVPSAGNRILVLDRRGGGTVDGRGTPLGCAERPAYAQPRWGPGPSAAGVAPLGLPGADRRSEFRGLFAPTSPTVRTARPPRLATWSLAGARGNFPMALDESHNRLFVGCRNPPEVLVLNASSGAILARLPSVHNADDLWYDAAHHRVYVSGGGGAITIIAQAGKDDYRLLAFVATPEGGRTSFLAPRLRRFYLGVWGRGGRPEELRIYQIPP